MGITNLICSNVNTYEKDCTIFGHFEYYQL